MIDDSWSDVHFFNVEKVVNIMYLSMCLEKPLFRTQLGRDNLKEEIIVLVELDLSCVAM